MKTLKQFLIILSFSFVGEVLRAILPLPVPASVYGLVALLTALCTGICKVSQVKKAAEFLIEIMPVMFIPAGVGLLNAWDVLEPIWIPVSVITAATTVIVMVVTGRVTQSVIRLNRAQDKKNVLQAEVSDGRDEE